jgi:hypothetical protein
MGRRRIWGKNPQGGAAQGELVGAATCRAAARVWGSRAGGEDAVQGARGGHPAAASAAREGRRPWGRRLRRPCLARHGGERQRKGKKVRERRADRRAPHGGDQKER